MIILVSNDDGIHSEGLVALENALKSLGEVYTVAPDRVQNSMSHALTLHRPLRVQEAGARRLAVDGTPADCVVVHQGYISVTPLQVDLTNHGFLSAVEPFTFQWP